MEERKAQKAANLPQIQAALRLTKALEALDGLK